MSTPDCIYLVRMAMVSSILMLMLEFLASPL